MKQIGEEAAAKAKESKKVIKKPVEVFDGTGEKEAETKAPETPKSKLIHFASHTDESKEEAASSTSAPIAALDLSALSIQDHSLDHAHHPQAPQLGQSMQSPTSTAWKAPVSKFTEGGGLQSPGTGAWHPYTATDVNPPITQHRGSDVEEASAEEIKKVEDCLVIQEEDEPEEDEDVKEQ
jgi:hypothetical protein